METQSIGETQSEKAPFPVHASAVVLGESGVMIRGASGDGKSTLALALVEACGGRGDFACLVGDDRVIVRIVNGRALVSPHSALSGLAEWRGIGLVQQNFEACVVLALIVDLESLEQQAGRPRLPEKDELCADFHGLHGVARLRLPARETERSVAAIMAFLHKVSPK
ncbi:HPr kinase/phosphorylase [Rhodoblastus sp.]|uniref:HPr kinase/phosphorylase n=1 Tax=Rhodoblastus sp. TaxID=1962975 RepID=UPI003F949DC3